MNTKSLIALLSLGISGVSIQVHAANDWYVSPSVSYSLNDSQRMKNNGWGVGVAIGKTLNTAWNIELNGRYLRLDGKKDELGVVGVDALRFLDRSTFAPYVVIGIGYAKEGGSNNNLMGNVGAGFLKQIGKNTDLRADLRYQIHDNRKDALGSGNLGDWLLSLGVNYSFGN